MTKEELKRQLKEAYYAYKTHEELIDGVAKLRSEAEKVTPAYSLAPGGGGEGKAMENSVLRLVEKEAFAADAYKDYIQKLETVRKLVMLLPAGPEQVVMLKRYYSMKRWEQIADEMSYSLRHIHRLHSDGLNALLRKTNKKAVE